MNHIIAPSILSADFAKLGEAVQLIDKSAAQFVHIDVMDGRFVPNITFGMPIIKAIRHYTEKVFDVHLMIVEPEKYIQDFRKAGADVISVHIEACNHLHRTIQMIKETGAKAGVAVNPHTNIQLLEDIIQDIDLVCLMSVNPGFGGQKFIENTYSKCRKLKDLIDKNNSHAKIEIDGGVTLENAPLLLNAGASVLVAGNTVFGNPNPIEMIDKLNNIDMHNLTV